MKALLLAAAACIAVPATATTLVTNANGIQSDEKGNVVRFSGFLVGEDGKIVSVQQKGEALPAADKTVNLDGRTVLPGLIDAHGHVLGLGQALLALDLTGVTSLADMQGRLKAYAAANPKATWIVGRGWNQESWAVKAFPSAADLDAIVADRPVVLERVDGHALVANSKAIELAGVTSATPAPSGGRIENGLFVDAAMDLIGKAVPAPTEADMDAALMKAQDALLSVGVTGAADMGTSLEAWNAMRRAGVAGRLKVRLFGYAAGLDGWRTIHDGTPTGWEFADRLALVGTKLYTDGALGSRGALLKAPYADKPDTRGLSLISAADLAAAVEEVAAGGGQLAVHAIGDAANAQVITAFEAMGAKHGRYHRPRIEHFQVVEPKDIPRLKAAGIVASMQPTHQTSDRLMAEARLGKDRLPGSYAWNTVLKLGIPLAFGSDFPVESSNPFPGLSAAVSRQDPDGQPPGGWRPDEKVTLGQALHGFTRGAAFAGHSEKAMGAIAPGMWADFIVIDRDPTAIDAQALARTKVLETWVAGEMAFTADATPD